MNALRVEKIAASRVTAAEACQASGTGSPRERTDIDGGEWIEFPGFQCADVKAVSLEATEELHAAEKAGTGSKSPRPPAKPKPNPTLTPVQDLHGCKQKLIVLHAWVTKPDQVGNGR